MLRVVESKVSCLICHVFLLLQPVCCYPSVIHMKKKLLSLLNLPWNTKNESCRNKKEFTVLYKLGCQRVWKLQTPDVFPSKVWISSPSHKPPKVTEDLAISEDKIVVSGRPMRKSKVCQRKRLGCFWLYEEDRPSCGKQTVCKLSCFSEIMPCEFINVYLSPPCWTSKRVSYWHRGAVVSEGSVKLQHNKLFIL